MAGLEIIILCKLKKDNLRLIVQLCFTLNKKSNIYKFSVIVSTNMLMVMLQYNHVQFHNLFQTCHALKTSIQIYLAN